MTDQQVKSDPFRGPAEAAVEAARRESRQSADREIEAMAEINELLEPFDNRTRRRMLEWVIAYQAEIPVACIPSPSRGED